MQSTPTVWNSGICEHAQWKGHICETGVIQATTTDYYFYSELAKVFMDAVVAGAETLRGSDGQGGVAMSLYDPTMIAFRTKHLKKLRHPIQVVMSGSGDLAAEKEYSFNLPQFTCWYLRPREARQRCRPLGLRMKTSGS